MEYAITTRGGRAGQICKITGIRGDRVTVSFAGLVIGLYRKSSLHALNDCSNIDISAGAFFVRRNGVVGTFCRNNKATLVNDEWCFWVEIMTDRMSTKRQWWPVDECVFVSEALYKDRRVSSDYIKFVDNNEIVYASHKHSDERGVFTRSDNNQKTEKPGGFVYVSPREYRFKTVHRPSADKWTPCDYGVVITAPGQYCNMVGLAYEEQADRVRARVMLKSGVSVEISLLLSEVRVISKEMYYKLAVSTAYGRIRRADESDDWHYGIISSDVLRENTAIVDEYGRRTKQAFTVNKPGYEFEYISITDLQENEVSNEYIRTTGVGDMIGIVDKKQPLEGQIRFVCSAGGVHSYPYKNIRFLSRVEYRELLEQINTPTAPKPPKETTENTGFALYTEAGMFEALTKEQAIEKGDQHIRSGGKFARVYQLSGSIEMNTVFKVAE